MTPEKFLELKLVGRVLQHFGPKNQHLYEPGFFDCKCRIVNRWSPVRDHLPEVFHCVITAYVSAISSLIVPDWPLHYIIKLPISPEIAMTQRADGRCCVLSQCQSFAAFVWSKVKVSVCCACLETLCPCLLSQLNAVMLCYGGGE